MGIRGDQINDLHLVPFSKNPKLADVPRHPQFHPTMNLEDRLLVDFFELVRHQENFEALQISLDAEDLQQIKALNQNYRYVSGSFFAVPNSGYTVEKLWDE